MIGGCWPLYPATSESEKISFNQLNRKTGHRIKYAKVDADTGEVVAKADDKLTARSTRKIAEKTKEVLVGRADLLVVAADTFDAVLSGKVKVQVHQTYSLRDGAQANRDLEDRKTTGSIVLLP